MKAAEQMKARIAGRHAAENPEHEAEVEHVQRAVEKNMANQAAARVQYQNGGIEIPPLPERPAELVELVARRAQLGRDRKTIEKELRQVEQKRWQEQQDDVDLLDQAAQRIADGETEVTSPDVIPEEIETLRKRLELARRAEAKLVNRVAEGTARHNRALAGALRPQHRAAVQRIHAALKELEAANHEEAAVRNAIPGAPLQYFGFPQLGTRGPNGKGPLKYWIGYAQRLGMLDENEDTRPAAAE